MLQQLDKILKEMEHEVDKMPTKLKKVAPVTQRLKLSETAILSSLVRYKPEGLLSTQECRAREEEDIYVVEEPDESCAKEEVTCFENYLYSEGYSGPFFAAVGTVSFDKMYQHSINSLRRLPAESVKLGQKQAFAVKSRGNKIFIQYYFIVS